MSARPRCTGAILAGGRSSRMGGVPKGLQPLGDARIIDRVAAALAEAADELIVVANDPAAPGWLPGVRVVGDVYREAGALGGIHAALSHAGGDVLVLSWDSPFVPAALLRALRNAGELGGAGAVVPASDSPWGFEPLCAWYAAAALGAIERRLSAGDHRAGALQEDIAVRRLDVSPWGDPASIFFNVNTPADLERAQVMTAATGAS
jgi:molybdopterin-guanine dinucleotide biosynthesis protein A